MTRQIVTPCAHVWRFVEPVRIAHKGRVHSSLTLRYRYACTRCSLVELRHTQPPETRWPCDRIEARDALAEIAAENKTHDQRQHLDSTCGTCAGNAPWRFV